MKLIRKLYKLTKSLIKPLIGMLAVMPLISSTQAGDNSCGKVLVCEEESSDTVKCSESVYKKVKSGVTIISQKDLDSIKQKRSGIIGLSKKALEFIVGKLRGNKSAENYDVSIDQLGVEPSEKEALKNVDIDQLRKGLITENGKDVMYASEDFKKVLVKLASDKTFNEKLKSDMNGTLREYNLTVFEQQAISKLDLNKMENVNPTEVKTKLNEALAASYKIKVEINR